MRNMTAIDLSQFHQLEEPFKGEVLFNKLIIMKLIIMLRKILFSMAFILGCINYNGFSATSMNSTFEYPFELGDTVWDSFESNETRLEALQIPEASLNAISTSRLLTLCLDFPYNVEIFCLGDVEVDCKPVFDMFNGYSELFSREDLSQVVLDFLEIFPEMIEQVKEKTLIEQGELSLKYKILLNIISFSKIGEGDQRDAHLINDKIEGLANIIKSYPQIFSYFAIPHSELSTYDFGMPEEWVTYNAGKVTLPNKYQIEVLRWVDGELSQAEKEHAKKIAESYKGEVVMEATNKYNCHGYAWYMYPLHLSDPVWIPEPDLYWKTGCYYEVPENEAEIVVYGGDANITHSALRLDSNLYISKWGNMPLVRHAPGNVPNEYGQPYKYYKTFPKPYLRGPETITNKATYSIGKIPTGFRVEWALSDNYYAQKCMEVNDSTCSISADPLRPLENASLTARIYIGNTLGWSLEIKISTDKDLYAINYNINGKGNLVLQYPYIIYAAKGDAITISSSSFIKASASYEGDITPSRWYWDEYSGRLIVNLPYTTSGSAIVIHITCVDGVKYDIIILKKDSSKALYAEIEGGDLRLYVSDIIDMIGLDRRSLETDNKFSSTNSYDTNLWEVEVTNVMTGTQVYNGLISQTDNAIEINGWASGIYIVRVRIGEIILYKKLTI